MACGGVKSDYAQRVNLNEQTNFKGKPSTAQSGIPYYKSYSGAAIAAIPASIVSISSMGLFLLNRNIKSGDKKTKEILNSLNTSDKKTVEDMIKNGTIKKVAKWSLIVAALHLACGAIVDAVRNKDARDTANKLVQPNNDIGTDLRFSNRGVPYKEPDKGAKVGAILGTGFSILSFVGNKALRIAKNKKRGVLQIITSVVSYVAGGALLGYWADKIAAKNTRNNL